MAIKFTDDQTTAINAKGTVLVSAAAGSGKTAVLTERVVRIICDKTNGVSADKLLIVTFTNLAAAELRQRILKEMTHVCDEHRGDEFYLKQKLLLQNAKICSIDSFCIDLVRNNFSALNIEPDFSIADNSVVRSVSDTCLDRCLLKYYALNDKDFNSLGEIFGLESSENKIKEVILNIYDYCMTLPQPKKWLRDAVARYSNDGYKQYIDYFFDILKNDVNELLSYISFAEREILNVDIAPILLGQYCAIKDFLNELTKDFIQADIDIIKNKISLFSMPKFSIRGCKEEEGTKELIKLFNSEIKKRFENIKGSFDGAICDDKEIETGNVLISKLAQLVEDYYDCFHFEMEKKKVFTFSMCEHLALRLLCDFSDDGIVPSALSEDICKNFSCVLVDEYQDNNDLQDALFFAVSDGGKNLFMVGDVKQCIYGFRNANPENFLRYKTEYPDYNEKNEKSKIILKSNFRSRKGVCDFVNMFCNAVMLKEVSGMDYTAEDELYAGACFPDIDTQSAELHLIENNTEEKNEIIEAKEIAEYIFNTVNNSERVIRDGDSLRAATYSDFAILLRSPSKRRYYYEEALKSKGIPVIASDDDFVSSPEVLSLISLLEALNNPTKDISFVALLSSLFFGFSYDELVDIRNVSKTDDFYSCVIKTANNGDKKCKKFLQEFSRLKTLSVTKPLGRFIRDICEIYPVAGVYGKTRGYSTVEKNLSKLAFLADKYVLGFGNGIEGFLKSLENYVDEGDSNIKSGVNGVKILSYHKSKGLQFPVCIIAATGCEFNRTDLRERCVFCDKFGIGLKYLRDGELTSSMADNMIIEYKKKQLIAEEIRIFYVAMTRAEDRLVIFGTSKSLEKTIVKSANRVMLSDIDTGRACVSSVVDSNSYLDFLLLSTINQKNGMSITKFAGLEISNSIDTAKFKVFTLSVDNFEKENMSSSETEVTNVMNISGEIDSAVVESLTKKIKFRYQYAEDSVTPSKIAVTELVHGKDNNYSFDAKPQFMFKFGLTPAERGTALHKFMQFADYKKASRDSMSELNRLREYEFLTETEAECIDLTQVEKFFKSSVYKRIVGANSFYREYKFMIEYPYGSSETIVQGIADCIFEESDGIVILDFKTDNVSDVNELLVRYRKQLEIYKYAIEKIFNKRVKECILYSLNKNDYVSF